MHTPAQSNGWTSTKDDMDIAPPKQIWLLRTEGVSRTEFNRETDETLKEHFSFPCVVICS